jgi:hypothetical protein
MNQENLEKKVSFLKENYDVLAKKINHYDAAFRILDNHINNKCEDLDRLENIAKKSDKTFEGIMKSIQILMNTQLLLKEQLDKLEKKIDQ